GDRDALHRAVARYFDGRLVLELARRVHDDAVRSAIDRREHAPRGLTHRRTVELDLDLIDLARGVAHVDGELGELALKLVDVDARRRLAILAAVFDRLAQRFVVRGPRGRELALVLPAVAEVQERAAAGVEALALGELGARLGEAALVHQLHAFVEERLRERL